MDKKSNKKYFLNIILILVLGATVIYFTMKDDLHASLRALTTASPLWIVQELFLMGLPPFLVGVNLHKSIFLISRELPQLTLLVFY